MKTDKAQSLHACVCMCARGSPDSRQGARGNLKLHSKRQKAGAKLGFRFRTCCAYPVFVNLLSFSVVELLLSSL